MDEFPRGKDQITLWFATKALPEVIRINDKVYYGKETRPKAIAKECFNIATALYEEAKERGLV